ncbi:LD-carboxypeptidase LdcB/DacB [Streptococcus sp. Marseille-P7376]|uniref:LD-carboxypeptidase LdcB/DacB n=1 Tax=Streptococcus sp. Marseille-P7376 TaxID=2592044 RepID=UPI0011E8886E|nr:LD-carboxypeptidase LdcB/DacB [Streptococcus sp. Marseille-P7376]
MKHRMFGRELQRFSIRKYSFGAASVLIGCILFLTGRPAFADSLAANPVEIANQNLDSMKEEATNQLTVVQAVTEQKEEVVATEKEKSESSVSTSDLPMQAENPSTMSEGAADTSTPSARLETEATRAADEKESSTVAVDTTVRMVAAAGTTSSEEQQIPKQSLPSQGQYTYTKRTEVKNEPKATAPTQFYVNAGDKVFYDRVLTTDGYQWISYKSYSGIRRYAAIEKLSQAEPQNPISDTPQGTLTITNVDSNASSFDVHVTNISAPKPIKKVALPTWFSVNGQDDIIWYDAKKQVDGTYKISVAARDHKYSTGEYNIHLYYLLADNQLVGVGGTKTTVSLAAPKGKLTIQNNNQQTGTFEVVVSEVENGYGIKEVKLPTWSSAEGQDDLIWYTAAKQADGTYKAQVNLRDHKYSTGEYNIHLYYVQDDGHMVGVGGTKTTANIDAAFIKKVRYNGSYYYVQGKYNEIVIANKKHPLASNYNPGENPTAKEAFVRLRNDMIAQGYNVGYGYSGFRSYDYQRNLYQHYVNTDGQAAADRYSARPGYSEHQTGLVFDLTDKSGNLLEDTAASTWLKNNAHRYGFVVRYQPGKEASTGYMPEAWHIRYIGQEAPDIYRSGLSLEEYYGFEGGNYATAPSNSSQSKPSLPAQGTYYFTKRSSIKAEPKQSSPELAYYTAGESVHYDRVLDADGMRWISYLSYSGNRRYISIG